MCQVKCSGKGVPYKKATLLLWRKSAQPIYLSTTNYFSAATGCPTNLGYSNNNGNVVCTGMVETCDRTKFHKMKKTNFIKWKGCQIWRTDECFSGINFTGQELRPLSCTYVAIRQDVRAQIKQDQQVNWELYACSMWFILPFLKALLNVTDKIVKHATEK